MLLRVAVRKNRYVWPERWARLLGRIPDGELAGRAGISRGVVREERQRRGIPAAVPRKTIDWTPAMLALLGTASDNAVAAELRLPSGTVTVKRRSLGIPPHGQSFRREPGYRWTPSALARLGKSPDGSVARALGLGKHTVWLKRHELGIAPYVVWRKVAWTRRALALLGRHSDEDVARHLGVNAKTVGRKRRELSLPPRTPTHGTSVVVNPELRKQLRLPAKDLQLRHSLARRTVLKLRQELGVAGPQARETWTPELVAKLGKESDLAIARAAGLGVSTVQAKRSQLRIAAFQRQHAWTKEQEALFFTLTNAEIAARLGLTLDAVKTKRHRLAATLRAS